MVADNESGKSIMSEVRTSSGMFLQKAQVFEKTPVFNSHFNESICLILESLVCVFHVKRIK